MSALINLTYLAVVILLGLFSTWLAKKMRVPYILFLLIVGVVLGNVHYAGKPLVQFPHLFTSSIALLALVMVVFESSSRFKYKDFDDFTIRVLMVTITILILNLTVLAMLTNLIFGLRNFFLAAMFAALMSGTSPVGVLSMLDARGNKVIKFLEIESLLNTTFIVLVPFIIIDLMETIGHIQFSAVAQQLAPFLQQIVTGSGAGLLIGLLMFKIFRRGYSQTLSPLAVIASAILTYVLAENLGGNGVLAVTVAGLMFGNVYVKEKSTLMEFSSILSVFLEILVFVLVGLLILLPSAPTFYLKSIVLFTFMGLLRFSALTIILRGQEYSLKQRLFMTLVAPKGVAVAAVTATIATIAVPGMQIVLNLILVFLLYSVTVSSIVIRLSSYFITGNIGKKIK